MSRYVAVVFSNPQPGKEAEYNDWYDHRHLDDIMGSGVVRAARRFRAVGKARREPAQQYMTFYEFSSDDLGEAKAKIAGGADPEEQQVIANLIDSDSVVIRFFELITESSAEE